jgi:iron complex outermembrane receptor protein
LRLNIALFYYEVDDLQLTAIGGSGNNTALINAASARAFGY